MMVKNKEDTINIIIKMSKKDYNTILNKQEYNGTYTDEEIRLIVNAIDDGKVLPKGHKELKDTLTSYVLGGTENEKD